MADIPQIFQDFGESDTFTHHGRAMRSVQAEMARALHGPLMLFGEKQSETIKDLIGPEAFQAVQ
jgi:hypothetical protein